MSHDGFLRDILENPEDDAPRLIYADWLDDQGDEHSSMRAAFIRAQITRARLHWPWVDVERWDACVERERPYLEWHRTEGMRELPDIAGISWDFHRGFIGVVQARSLVAFQKHAPAALEKFPLQEIQFIPLDNRRQLILNRPRPAHPNRSPITSRDASLLAVEPLLGRFRRLDLQGNPLGEDGVRRLLESPHLASLRALRLAQTGLDEQAARLISSTPTLAGLEELDLSYNHIGTRGAKALADSPFLKGLRWLVLFHCRIDYRSRAAHQLRQQFGKGLRW
jgi:uncharacterized protein (TIGR02996 family)